MKRTLPVASALLALTLLAACVTSGSTPAPDPSIDATTLDLSGQWKVRSDDVRKRQIWRGVIDLARDGDGYTGTMRWLLDDMYEARQAVRCTVTRDTVTIQGTKLLHWDGGGIYYLDTFVMAPASATMLVGKAGDTGANSSTVKVWRPE